MIYRLFFLKIQFTYFFTEEEAEADSFVGQSTGPQTKPGIPNYFQSTTSSGHDPFSQIGHAAPPPSIASTFSPASVISRSATPPSSNQSPLTSAPTIATPPVLPANSSMSGFFYILNAHFIFESLILNLG